MIRERTGILTRHNLRRWPDEKAATTDVLEKEVAA